MSSIDENFLFAVEISIVSRELAANLSPRAIQRKYIILPTVLRAVKITSPRLHHRYDLLAYVGHKAFKASY